MGLLGKARKNLILSTGWHSICLHAENGTATVAEYGQSKCTWLKTSSIDSGITMKSLKLKQQKTEYNSKLEIFYINAVSLCLLENRSANLYFVGAADSAESGEFRAKMGARGCTSLKEAINRERATVFRGPRCQISRQTETVWRPSPNTSCSL